MFKVGDKVKKKGENGIFYVTAVWKGTKEREPSYAITDRSYFSYFESGLELVEPTENTNVLEPAADETRNDIYKMEAEKEVKELESEPANDDVIYDESGKPHILDSGARTERKYIKNDMVMISEDYVSDSPNVDENKLRGRLATVFGRTNQHVGVETSEGYRAWVLDCYIDTQKPTSTIKHTDRTDKIADLRKAQKELAAAVGYLEIAKGINPDADKTIELLKPNIMHCSSFLMGFVAGLEERAQEEKNNVE